jgi:CubicO group peptidase (beta-lactamase class C family)
MFKTFALLITTMTTFTLLGSSPQTLDIAALDRLANEALRQFDVPGAAVGIIVDGQVILSKGYGLRNAELQLPVTETTQFPIASCTKGFTALLVGSLVQEGKLAWDDPVKKYIPEWTLLDQMTVRDLLAHRTGMPRHDAIWIFNDHSRNHVLELYRHLNPEHALGTEFQYNNFMYSVIGIVVERLTGQSWEQALQERVLMPLSMHSANTSIDALQEGDNYSLPYAEINSTLQCLPFQSPYVVAPGGGINASISDMLKWVSFQLDRKEKHAMQMPFPTPPKSIVSKPSIDDEMKIEGYGLGWFLGKYRGHEWIFHGGCLSGFFSDVSFLPEKGIGVVILTNSSTDGTHIIQILRNHILDELLSISPVDRTTPFLSTREKSKRSIQESMEQFAKLSQEPVATEMLTQYAGSYHHPAYGAVHVTLVNNHLQATYGTMVTPLYQKSDHVFAGKADLLATYGINPVTDFTFFADDKGQIETIQIPFEGFRSAKPISFKRIN